MELSNEGAHVLTAGHDEEARLRDVRTGKEVAFWTIASSRWTIALSRLADVAVIGTTAGAEVWRLARPSRMPVLRHDGHVTRIRLSPDGSVLAAFE